MAGNSGKSGVPTPWTHTAVTAKEITTEFGPSGSVMQHTVTVPQGTRCRKLQGGSGVTWVVSDLSFIDKKANGFMYHDADHYGILIAEESLPGITPV